MKLPRALVPYARPLYTAPDAELSTTRLAVDLPAVTGSTAGFHAVMVPSSPSKMNVAPIVVPGIANWLGLGFHTMPVGADESAGGIVTTSGTIAPAPLYSVDTLPLLSEAHSAPPGAQAIPHGFRRLASGGAGARPGM